jgi:type I restriction-modification system DNA methylase subunit
VRSKQRVSDHGEVFTPPNIVQAMLDLVRVESERIDSRFLEPSFMCKWGVSRDIPEAA